MRLVDLPTNKIASRVCKVLAQVSGGCAESGQGLKVIVSWLCTLDNWVRKHEAAR